MKVKIWLITALMACLWCLAASRGTSGVIDEQGSMVPPTVEKCERDYACQNWQSASQFCATGQGSAEKACLCSSGIGDAMRDCVYCMEDTIEGLEWPGLGERAFAKYTTYCKDRTIDVDEFKSRGFKLTTRYNFPLLFFTGNYHTPWVWAHAKGKELQRRVEPRAFDIFSTIFSVETQSVAAKTSTVEVVFSQETITAQEPTSTIATTLLIPGVPTSPPFVNATTSAAASRTTGSDLQIIPAATSTVSFQVPESEVLPASLFSASSITAPQVGSPGNTSSESTSTLISLLEDSITSVIISTSVVQSTSIITSIMSVSVTTKASPISNAPENPPSSQLPISMTATSSTFIIESTTELGSLSSSLSSALGSLITAEPFTTPATTESQLQPSSTAIFESIGTISAEAVSLSSNPVAISTQTLLEPSTSTSLSKMLSSILSSDLIHTSSQISAPPLFNLSVIPGSTTLDSVFGSQTAVMSLNTSPSAQILPTTSSTTTTSPAALISILITTTIPTPSQIPPPIQSSANPPSILVSYITSTSAALTTLPSTVLTLSSDRAYTTVSTMTMTISPTRLAGPIGVSTSNSMKDSGGCAGPVSDCVISWYSFGSTEASGFTIVPTTSSSTVTMTMPLQTANGCNPETTITVTTTISQILDPDSTEPLSCINFSTLSYIYSSTSTLNSTPPTPTPTTTRTPTSTESTLLTVPSAYLTYPPAPSNTSPNTTQNTNPYPGTKTSETITSHTTTQPTSNPPLTLSIIPLPKSPSGTSSTSSSTSTSHSPTPTTNINTNAETETETTTLPLSSSTSSATPPVPTTTTSISKATSHHHTSTSTPLTLLIWILELGLVFLV